TSAQGKLSIRCKGDTMHLSGVTGKAMKFRDSQDRGRLTRLAQQDHHVGPEFLARFSLGGRQVVDSRPLADAGEVDVLLPVLERLANPGVFLGFVGKLGPGSEVGAEPVEGLLAEASALLVIGLDGIRGLSGRGQSGAARSIVAVPCLELSSKVWV